MELRAITREDIETLWRMQVEAFSDLLMKYQDYDTNPGAESLDKIIAKYWCLDTILQEKGCIRLYEKLGYHPTGRVEKINDRMDIVFYEKG